MGVIKVTYFLSLSPCDLFLDGLCIGLRKQIEQSAAEVMRVTVGVAQLVGQGIQEKIATYRMK